ncbi:MAG: anti-sigma E factor RseA [Mycobacterium sp.]
MFEPGRFFRGAISRLPANFVAVDEAALAAPRKFTSTDHLSTEAVAAYVDGELPMKAHLRAASHLAACRECAAEVEDQGQARAALRESRPVSMPSTLMGLLTQIPESNPEEPTPAPQVSDRRPGGAARGRRKRR